MKKKKQQHVKRTKNQHKKLKNVRNLPKSQGFTLKQNIQDKDETEGYEKCVCSEDARLLWMIRESCVSGKKMNL